jgi:hypothetical protein
VNVLGFPRAFRASDPEPMDEARILVRLGNLTSVNMEIVGGRPARYYVMDIDHVSPIACTHFIIITTKDRSRRLPASFEILQSSRRPRKITRPQLAGPLTPSLNRVPIPSGQTFRAWNLSGRSLYRTNLSSCSSRPYKFPLSTFHSIRLPSF